MKFSEARDFIIEPFYSIWGALGLTVVFDDLPGKVPQKETWARVTLMHVNGNQSSLSNAFGKIKWNRTGILIIQLFSPVGNGLQILYDLSQQIVDKYQLERNNCVWFRNAMMNEIGIDGSFYQVNVNVEFEYTDVV